MINFEDIQKKCNMALNSIREKKLIDKIENLENVIESVGRSWCKSWIGYHAYVYYHNFTSPPPGEHFSSEWGFNQTFSNPTSAYWIEYKYEDVINEILARASFSDPDIDYIVSEFKEIKKTFDEAKSEIVDFLEVEFYKAKDKYLEKLLNEITEIKVIPRDGYLSSIRPTQIGSRDSMAMSQGLQYPPHLAFYSHLISLKSINLALENTNKIIKKTASYLGSLNKTRENMESEPNYIFIGHGRSKVWKDLKDFLNDRLNLSWDEFNRESPAGVTTKERLEEMLNRAKFAFLIMTAEDEQSDGKKYSRQNVVHEIGLFQGKLGFTKAIVLLEEGCEEFSNIIGLGQIRFPQNNIETKFEEIRKVLEREKII